MEDDTILARWLADELDGNELDELKKSPRYESLLKIRNTFDDIQSPVFDRDKILAQTLQQEKTPVKTIPLYRKYYYHAAAAVVVMLVALGITFTAPEEFAAPHGETVAFSLPDQSGVILNAGSIAKFRKWNWDSNRSVELEGEAYFKVAKGKKFTVQTDLGTVSVLGTQFNVKARDGRFTVTCYEGRVAVKSGAKNSVITAGQTVTLASGISDDVTLSSIKEPEWLHDEVVFTEEKLEAVTAELERQYNVKIAVGVASQQRFSGSLPANDLDAALKIITRTYHLSVEKQNSAIILKPEHAGQ